MAGGMEGGGENIQKHLTQEKAVRGASLLSFLKRAKGMCGEFVPINTVEGAMGQSQPKSFPSCAPGRPMPAASGPKARPDG